MKKKILVPMFASIVALSASNVISNADEAIKVENKDGKTSQNAIDIGEYKEVTYKKAIVKEGIAVKIRKAGQVKRVAYSGDEFKVLATQGEWVEVLVNGEEAWIPERYVDLKLTPAYTTEEKVNFRKDSNKESEIIEELEKGTKLEVVQTSKDWIRVKSGDKEGYVSAKYLSDEAPVVEEVTEDVDSVQVTNRTTTSTSNKSTSSNISKKQNTNSNKQNSTTVSSANKSVTQAVVNLAYSKIGCPYVWGSEGPNSFDCSGLTSYVYKKAAGVSLPRTSSAQSTYGKTVSKSNLQAGDLVFFGSGSVSHVGIYIGGGNMIHSPKPGENVKITSINSSYYSNRFITAKRVL